MRFSQLFLYERRNRGAIALLIATQELKGKMMLIEEAMLLPEVAENLQKEKIIRLPDVMDATGLRRSSIYQKIAENTFPMQIILGAKAVGWREREVQKWIKDKIEKSQNKRVEHGCQR